MEGSHLQTFPKKSVIYSPFSEVKKVFIIKTGYVSAHTIDATGKTQIHLVYGPLSYFPVITTFKDKDQRATYTALTNVNVELYNRDEFSKKIDSDKDFCKEILLQSVEQLGLFADRIINLETTKTSDRLKHRINALCQAHGKHVGDFLYLPYELTHQQVADMIGAERETVSRLLMQLLKNGDIYKSSLGTYGILLP